MAARTISLVNFKGGVGKTSLAVNIAGVLAHTFNQRVLLVDCDLQSNSSIWLMGIANFKFKNQQPGQTIGGSFLPNARPMRERIVRGVLTGRLPAGPIHKLDLLPATYALFDFEERHLPHDFYVIIAEELKQFEDEYDYIIFDCPPNLFKSSRAAIFASREIYVPCNPDLLSVIGLNLLINKLNGFHDETDGLLLLPPYYRPARINGAILNQVPANAVIDGIANQLNLALDQVAKAIQPGAGVIPLKIPAVFAAGKVIANGLPLVVAPGIVTPAAKKLSDDYIHLTEWIHLNPPSN